ncbi:MAG: pyridoxamine 5'-phosphate oxidase family protein [Deltaproteobacteria bacterium]|nr:pyridoxamine 5'-phosphate oxidase family protein [Deltaproteobacteria bacterium]
MLPKMKRMLKEKDICVLATVSGNQPHCSLMAYVAAADGREIYMMTLRDTKKYRNLTENPAVSLLIDTREDDAGPQRPLAKALTVTGVFQRVEKEKQAPIRARILGRHPHLQELFAKGEAEIFAVRVESFQLLEGATDSHFERVD